MNFEKKLFDKDDFSQDRREYETQKIWFMSWNSPFSLVSILFMSEQQRNELFEWVLTQPEKRSPLLIEGCGSSQEEYDQIQNRNLEKTLEQHVTDKGVRNGKRKGQR